MKTCPVCRKRRSRPSDREFGLCRRCWEWINELWLARHQLRTALVYLGVMKETVHG